MAPTLRWPAFIIRLLLPALALLVPALAQADPPPEIGLRIGGRGLGEVWQDASLIQVYRSSRFTGSGVVSYRVWCFLSADLEVGYERQGGVVVDSETLREGVNPTSFELIPISAMAEASRRLGDLDVFAAVGCAITPYTETRPGDTVTGTKFGAAFQLGARLDTKLAQPSWRSGDDARLQAVEFEVFVGRRQHQLFGVGSGLDLSAWRFGAGLLARF
ncbi:MAG: hypothetical protein ABIO70_36160 [Pseudomonadota bacterium]